MHVKAKNLTHDNTWRCPPGSELLIMPTCIISSKGGFQCTHALDIMPQCSEYPQVLDIACINAREDLTSPFIDTC